jgi:predicted nucleic acid-binding protein
MIACVDTNIILDVAAQDQPFAEHSRELLAEMSDKGVLVMCDVVYAELVPQFESREQLDFVVSTLGIRLTESGADVAYLAGQRWAAYRAAGGNRERLVADFLIGAHAVLRADCLLSRDRGFFKSYFAELKLCGGQG